ncbi:MAG: hypothetical protein Q9162_005816 [Coniocarpon cinnabarinum]
MSKDSEKYDSLPIPTYEEATSRPSSSASRRGPGEVSDDAERQGLLNEQVASAGSSNNYTSSRRGRDGRGNYRPPTVESARSSYDSALTSPELTDEEDQADAELRRDLEELEVSDPEAERRAQQRARMRREFHKRLATVTATFSNLHLPRFPNITIFSSLRERFPRLPFPERGSVSWPIVARLVALLVIASVIYLLIAVKIVPGRGAVGGMRFEPDSIREFLIRHVDPSKIESHLRELSFDDHIAGTRGDMFLAHFVEDWFKQSKVDTVFREDFKILMNFPKANNEGRRIAILEPSEKRWESSLAEENVPQDLVNPTVHPGQAASLTRHQSPAFQPYSYSGEVTGSLVYANYGSREDFEWLRKHDVSTEGAIALVRHYGSQPDVSLKIAAAKKAGCIGALVYSDPAEDGPEQVDGAHSPSEEPWRSPDSVHRTSVALHSEVLGDPLTPGWSSTPDASRLNHVNMSSLPSIPSLPLSWRDAEPLLKSLQNVGTPIPDNMAGAVPNIAYWTGNATSEASPGVNLQNHQDEEEQQTIRNVFASLTGLEEPKEPIYIGAPRDALCFGAVQPGSGTAILMELAHLFGRLAANGWRPRRTLVFASWDAGEYNAAGSTEHVEARLDELRLRGISYINLASAVYGTHLKARGSPVFRSVLHSTLARVVDPSTNTSLLETWNASRSDLESLPTSLGDFLPFHDLAGMSSLDLSFTSALNADRAPPGGDTASITQQTPAAFPKGSCHDTLAWLTNHGDPGFLYHALLTQVVAILVYELADAPLLPLDLQHYSSTITSSIDDLITDLHAGTKNSDEEVDKIFNLAMLRDAGAGMARRINGFDAWTAGYLASMGASIEPGAENGNGPGGLVGEPPDLAARRVAHNQHIAEFESHLLDLPLPNGMTIGDDDDTNEPAQNATLLTSPQGSAAPPEPSESPDQRKAERTDEMGYGLPYAPQYKHVFHGPRKWDSGSNRPFPAIREAFAEGDWEGVRKAVEVASSAIRWAGWRLAH